MEEDGLQWACLARDELFYASCAGIPKPYKDAGAARACAGADSTLSDEERWATMPVVLQADEVGTRGTVDEITAQIDDMLADRGPGAEEEHLLFE